MDLTRITVFCFTASYAVALSLEAVSLARRFGVHRPVLLGFAAAGLFAHLAFLVVRAREVTPPLSSPSDWCLLAALVLAALYAAATFLSPRQAIGVFLLPIVLALIGLSRAASSEPVATERASYFWGQTHSWLLILATVTVTLGFIAGLAYLIKSWRLKQKLPASKAFPLPSLETLEKINSRSLGISVWLVAGGYVSGLVLIQLTNAGNSQPAGHGSAVIVSLSTMFGWLVIVELFRLLYPAARRGRKVAYLTVASFVFLAITLTAMTIAGRANSAPSVETEAGRTGWFDHHGTKICRVGKVDALPRIA